MRTGFQPIYRRFPILFTTLGVWAAILLSSPAKATSQGVDYGAICDQAASQAAMESGVPLDILLGITRVETGRGRNGVVQPWPWTVNIEGTGAWFDTADHALRHVLERQAAGARSFDVGCFQINHRWHGEHFASIAEMFDPLQNARYAAQFLTDLHQEFGSWRVAVGAYHSRTRRHASRYLRAFERHVAELGPVPEEYPPQELILSETPSQDLPSLGNADESNVPLAENTFPLLQRNDAGSRSIGSLVPLSANGFAMPVGG